MERAAFASIGVKAVAWIPCQDCHGVDLNNERRLKSLIKLEWFVLIILMAGALAAGISGIALGQPILGLGGFFLIGLLVVYVWLSLSGLERQLRDLPTIRLARREKVRRTIQSLAGKFEGTIVEDETGLPSFSTVLGGQAVKFRASETMLLISSILPVGLFRLFIYPHEQLGAKFRNVVDVQVGDSRFDSRFAVQTNDSSKVRSFLSKPLQDAISGLADELAGQPMGVSLNGGQVFLSIPLSDSPKNSGFEKALDLLALFQQETGIWSGKAVLDILPPKKTEEAASCLVCGDHVQQDIVKCRLCRTSHHRDCWQYIGHCSVFGCGSTKFDRA